MRSDFETSGDIRDVDLLAAFVGIWKNATSGAISFSRSAASAGFGLAGGEIVSVSSSEARFESSAILVRAGKLDATALERLAIPEGTDGALAALQTGILTKREWRWGEKIRAIEVLADLLAWPDGKYYFDADARPVATEFTLTVPRLLLELFLRSRDRNLIEHQLGRADAPIVRAPDFDHQFSTFGLTADAESVVRLIDGRATADEIARTAPAEDFAVRKLLAALTTLGLVHAGTDTETAVQAASYSGVESEEENAEVALETRAEEPVEVEGGQPWESEVSEVETTQVSAPDPRSGSPWDVPVRESSTRRTGAFAFDPPGSTSPLEAFPLPAGARARVDDDEDEESRSEADGNEPGDADEIGRYPATEPDSAADAFSPFPDHGGLPPGGGDRKGGPGLGTVLGGLVAFLVVAILAVLYFRSRPVSTVRAAADSTPAPIAAARLAPTAFAAAVAREASPSPAPVAVAAFAKPTANSRPPVSTPVRGTASPARPTAMAPRTTTAPVRPTAVAVRPAAPPAPTARPTRTEAASEKGAPSDWTARAARDRRRLESEHATRYAIQLELACETPSLSQAWTHDRPAGSMWLLETRHGSRNCFRVLWGRYPSLDAAKRAKSGIPSFFTTATNRPAIVSVR